VNDVSFVESRQQALRLSAGPIDPALESRDKPLEQHWLAQPVWLQMFAYLFVAAPDGKLRLLINDAGPRRQRVPIGDRDEFQQLISEASPNTVHTERALLILSLVGAATFNGSPLLGSGKSSISCA
jgi:hypothetical protein